MTAVGEGKMDWPPIMDAMEEAAVHWQIVELDRCASDMLEAVRGSYDYLVDAGYARRP